MTSDSGDLPKATVDPEPERAPGGADAVETIADSDVGVGSEGDPVTPDPPFSAQQEESDIPDQILEGERPEPKEQETDNTNEPSS